MVNGRGRNRVQIHAHGSPADGAVDEHERARVPTLAVDQDEHLVGTEAAEAGGVDVVGAVGDGLVRRVERRGEGGEDLVHFGLADLHDLGGRNHVDRDGGLGRGTRGAGADDGHLGERQRAGREPEVGGDRLAGTDRDALLRSGVPDDARPQDVRAGGDAQVVFAAGIRDGGARRADQHHRGVGERCAGLRGDGAGNCAGLLLGGEGRRPGSHHQSERERRESHGSLRKSVLRLYGGARAPSTSLYLRPHVFFVTVRTIAVTELRR